MQNKSDFGIGTKSKQFFCKKLGLRQINKYYNNIIYKDKIVYITENILKKGPVLIKKQKAELEKLILIDNYRYKRVLRKLPARGQRTQTNAKSQKNYKIPISMRYNNKKTIKK